MALGVSGLDFETIPVLRVDSTLAPSSRSPLPVSPLQAAAGAVGLPVAMPCMALWWQEEPYLWFVKEVQVLTHG